MQLMSINVGREQTLQNLKSGKTGICKDPVSGPVEVTEMGLRGDVICDTKNHGGADQALYAYSTPDYDWWSESLGSVLTPGTFGENLTISGLESASLNIGDRLHFGWVTIEVTAPRIPCSTLAARMGDPVFAKRFRRAERPGLYCRVIKAGWLQAGEVVRLEPCQGQAVSILEAFRDFYVRRPREENLRRFLAAPIDIRSRLEKEKQLAKLLAKSQPARGPKE
jgi:MOSC domain-containing protein YiiM